VKVIGAGSLGVGRGAVPQAPRRKKKRRCYLIIFSGSHVTISGKTTMSTSPIAMIAM